MFQFPGFASRLAGYRTSTVGCPIRKSVVDSGYLPLTTAYRSLSRPSSPPRAKASFMCPFLLSFYFWSFSPVYAFLPCVCDTGPELWVVNAFCVGIELLPLPLARRGRSFVICLDSFDLLVFGNLSISIFPVCQCSLYEWRILSDWLRFRYALQSFSLILSGE